MAKKRQPLDSVALRQQTLDRQLEIQDIKLMRFRIDKEIFGEKKIIHDEQMSFMPLSEYNEKFNKAWKAKRREDD